MWFAHKIEVFKSSWSSFGSQHYASPPELKQPLLIHHNSPFYAEESIKLIAPKNAYIKLTQVGQRIVAANEKYKHFVKSR